MNQSKQTVMATLEKASYADLLYVDNGALGAQLCDSADSRAALHSLLGNAETVPKLRFLAAEVLRACHDLNLDTVDKSALAESYCYALATCTAESGYSLGLAGNAWGYLWHDGDPGLGQVLIDLGEASIPSLGALVSNTELVQYEGSREATTGNLLQYRVKDFAAYYLHRISNIPLRPVTIGDRDFAARDSAIEKMLDDLDKD